MAIVTKGRIATVAVSAALAIAAAGGLADRGGAPPELVAIPGEYIVHWRAGSSAALDSMAGVRVLDSQGAAELAKIGAFVVAVDGPDAVGRIMAAGAEYVEPNTTLSGRPQFGPFPLSLDPLVDQQWHLSIIGAASAWRSARGQGVTVAVVDSGVGPHPDLAVVGGKDFTGGDGGWSDVYGHGTHVAGICCARQDNGIGGSGVAPLARVLSVRVLGAGGYGDNASIAAGIVWAADNGAKVINLSLGSPSRTRSIEEALSYARARGALPVCAAGNDGSTRPDYPAAYESCLSVAASTRTDTVADFSNRAPSVDITAPGDNVLSSCVGGAFCSMSGTSMAAPVVAGVAALVLSQSAMSPDALGWRLRSSAAARPRLPAGRRIDASAALAARPTGVPAPATLAPRPTAPVTARPLPGPSASPTAGGVRIVPIVVPPGCRLVIMCEPAYPGP